ncbi:ATP binding cassette (ABC) protein subfamily H member, partial [Diabrotica virgifera virgifera]
IGLMRSGKLLAEESPQVLLQMYQCTSLEDVFLKLSRKQVQVGAAANDQNMANNISLATLNWSKKESVSVTEESGVVGLNFHQSKEVLVPDSNGHLD